MANDSDISKGKSASLLEFLLTIGLAVAFMILFSMAIYTKDILWFWPVFKSQPVSALLRCYGEKIYLERNPADINAITNLVNEQLSNPKRWDELNLSDQNLQVYQSSPLWMVLELYYDEPQRVHSSSPFFSGFDSFLIPLDGSYADTSIIFPLIHGKPGGSSFHVESFQPVVDYLAQQDICTKADHE